MIRIHVNIFVSMLNWTLWNIGLFLYILPLIHVLRTVLIWLTTPYSLLQLIDKLSDNNFTTVVLGDFNLPKIDWQKLDSVNDGIHDLVFNHMSQLGFTQFVSEPTRYNNSSIGNILDLIFSNDHLAVNIAVNIEDYHSPLGNSDHSIINFNVYSNFVENVSISDVHNDTQDTNLTIFDWSAANFDQITNHLNAIDWHLVFGYNFDADSIWHAFRRRQECIMAHHCYCRLGCMSRGKLYLTIKNIVLECILGTFGNF